MTISTVQRLRDRGFDRSEAVPFQTRWHVACSRCEAAVLNGLACHERGCPPAREYQTISRGDCDGTADWNSLAARERDA